MEDEIYECEQCGQENLESELEQDDYAQYVGFSEELNCPNCKSVVK